MERKILLNFVANNYDTLTTLNTKRISIYLFGMNCDNSKYSIFYQKDKVYCYDLKLPRIDKKIFDLSYMEEGLLGFSISLKKEELLKKDQLIQEIDPFSNKNLGEFNFDYLLINPIIVDNINQGVIFIYSTNQMIVRLKGVNKLINDLCTSFDQSIDANIINKLIKMPEEYVIKNNDLIYKSNDLINIDDFYNNYQVKSFNLDIPYQDYVFYYKQEIETGNELLHLSNLNKLPLNKTYYLIITEAKINEIKKLKTKISDNIDLYDLEDNFYLLLIPYLSIKIIKNALNDYHNYYLLLKSPNDVNSKMDLKKIFNYIKDERIESFKIDNYKEYIKELGEEEYNLNIIEANHQYIYSTTNSTLSAFIVNNKAFDIKHQDNFDKYNKDTIKKLNKNLENELNSIFSFVNSSIINNRNMKEIYKKYQNANKKLNLIIHFDHRISKDKLMDALIYLKNNHIGIYFDSSVAFNLEMLDLVKISDGIYINEKEFNAIEDLKEELANLIVSYYLKMKLKLIFEETNEKLKDANYISDNIYSVLQMHV